MQILKNSLGVVLVALFFMPAFSLAAELRVGEQLATSADETIEDDLYIAGGSVVGSAAVRGDLVGAGGNVLLNGEVLAGDVLVVGGNVTVLGGVSDDVRLAGGTVLINSVVGGDLIVAGGQIQIAGAGIGGDVLAAGGVVILNAPVGGGMKIVGGEVVINTTISGNVLIRAEKVTLGNNAVIRGNLDYRAKEEIEILEGQVIGEVTLASLEGKADKGAVAAGLFAFLSLWFLMKIVMAITAGFVLLVFLRRYASELVTAAYARPWMELLRGFLTFVATPVLSVILLFTVIGIPIGALGLIGFIGILIFAGLVAPLILGSLLYKWLSKGSVYAVTYSSIVIGAVAYHALGLIPVVGWAVQLVFFLIAVGSMLSIKLRVLKEWR